MDRRVCAIVACQLILRVFDSMRLQSVCVTAVTILHFLCHHDVIGAEHSLTVATYNIWNIMFNWEIRQLRIAQMIKEQLPDVIAFQEVRSHRAGGHSQVDDLAGNLRQYPWRLHAADNTVPPLKHVYKEGWEREGVGLLSRLPILNHTSWPLTYHKGPDQNHRSVLHARVRARGGGLVNILVVHLSYDRHQQCGNVQEIRQYIDKHNLMNVVVLGDFNTYQRFDYPLQMLSRVSSSVDRACPEASQQAMAVDDWARLQDAWVAANPALLGYTFSNMPEPGMESRPDRVLVSSTFKVRSASLHGNGTTYKERFGYHITWRRLENVMTAMRDSYQGHRGRSCRHDCGPHGSCRCGVCVAIGDKDTCLLPGCEECTSYYWIQVWVVLFSFVLCLAMLIHSLLLVLHTLNRETQNRITSVTDALGIHCCLLNPVLYTKSANVQQRHCWLARQLPCLRLPPMVLVALTLLTLLFIVQVTYMIFDRAIQDTNYVLPEELFPSDHLMLVADLTWDA